LASSFHKIPIYYGVDPLTEEKIKSRNAVRAFIERVQPLLTLHGHIHESPGHTRIGKTLCINAGSEYAEGIMKAAIINLEDGKVKGHLLISG